MYDLDAIVAEELGEQVRIEFTCGGEPFSIPGIRDWPDQVLEALLTNDVLAVGKRLLGEQYEAYGLAGGNSQKLILLIGRAAKSQGVDLPESSASTGS